MNYVKVFTIPVLIAAIVLQLCHTSAIKANTDYKKFNYPKQIREHNIAEYKKSSRSSNDHARQPRSTESDNNSTVEKDKEMNKSMTNTIEHGISIVDQKYSQNTTGEYKHEVLFSNGAWRAEQGEYEDHNGVIVFVIRGVFSYFTKQGTYNTTLYIVDEFGYHNVQTPTQITQDGFVDYRPDITSGSLDCDAKQGTYCIDPKLLALMVG